MIAFPKVLALFLMLASASTICAQRYPAHSATRGVRGSGSDKASQRTLKKEDGKVGGKAPTEAGPNGTTGTGGGVTGGGVTGGSTGTGKQGGGGSSQQSAPVVVYTPGVRADGTTVSSYGVYEPTPCLDPSKVPAYMINHVTTDSRCTSGVALTAGCCRMFHGLVLDDSNDFPHLQCVCGATTWNGGAAVDVTNGSV
jgi:hypothetical protein